MNTSESTPKATGLDYSKLVYVLEDDPDLQNLLTYNLEQMGYSVRCFSKAEPVLEILDTTSENLPAALVVDVNLAGHMNGVEATRFLRNRKHTATLPIMMLTAKGDAQDVVRGLEEGADDYLPKPFEMDVFVARLKACMRRAEKTRSPVGPGRLKLAAAGIEIDPVAHSVMVLGKPMELTVTEFGILTSMMNRPNEVLGREDLVIRVMGPSKAVTARTIDVHVKSLRAKLGKKAKHIETVRGVGYKFVP